MTTFETISKDVIIALVREGVLAAPPKGKRDLLEIHAAFDAWSKETKLDLTSLSRTSP
jgi:hypothetical protein